MTHPSVRARLARWIGGLALNDPEPVVPVTPGEVTEEVSETLSARVTRLEAEVVDLAAQQADTHDLIRKWLAKQASQKAAETRSALAALGNGSAPETPSEAQPTAPDEEFTNGFAARRAALKAELTQRFYAGRRR